MKQRKAEYEFIRSIAMVMVIGVHTLANVPAGSPAEQLFNNILGTIFFLCNGLFFMLSGKFALASVCETWEDYKNYYIKKAVGLGVPILVYMAFRTMYDFGWNFPVRTITKQYVLNVLGGYASIEYWFLYTLVGMLLVAPVLGKFCQKAGGKELLLVLGIGFAFDLLEDCLPAGTFHWGYSLDGAYLVFMLGYGLERLVTNRKRETIVYILAVISIVIKILRKTAGFAPGMGDDALTACSLCGAFLGLKRLYRPGKIADRIWTWVGKYSMSVYMVHAMVLTGLVERINLGNYFLQVAVLMLLTVVISLAIGFAVDNILIRNLQKPLLGFLKK